MGDGYSFGELALINDKPRAATITCESDSHFLVVNKHTFKTTVEKSIQRALKK